MTRRARISASRSDVTRGARLSVARGATRSSPGGKKKKPPRGLFVVVGLFQIAAEALDALAGVFEARRSRSRRRCGNAGERPKAEPCTTATPSVSSSSVDEVLVVGDHLARRRGLADGACAGRIDVERAFRTSGSRCRFAWFSIETTRSRRSLNSLAFGLMKSCGPFSASTAAHCEIDDGFDVDCDSDRRHRLDQRRPGRRHSRCASRSWHRPSTRRSWSACGRRASARPAPMVVNWKSSIDEVLVHVVGHDPDLRMAQQHVGERLQLGPRVGGAGRVRRRVQDDPLGLRRDRALRAPAGWSLKPVVGGASTQATGVAAGEQHDVPDSSPSRARARSPRRPGSAVATRAL